jgi:hypothetical protein
MNDKVAEDAVRALKALAAPDYCLWWPSDWCMSRSEWASWMQAFAGLIALLIAVALPIWQRREQLLNQYEERLQAVIRTISGPLVIAEAMSAKFDEVGQHFMSQSTEHATAAIWTWFHPNDFAPYLESLASVDIEAIPSAPSVAAVLAVRANFAQVIRYLEAASKSTSHGQFADLRGQAQVSLREGQRNIELLRTDLVRATHPEIGVVKYPHALPKTLRVLLSPLHRVTRPQGAQSSAASNA